MQPSRFDALTRALGSGRRSRPFRRASAMPAMQQATPGGRVPGEPGDLVASEEITDRNDPNFPPAARAWRITYVSTGRDNTERTLVRGIVVAPADLAALDRTGRAGRMVAWTHGTLGVIPRCQPSANPALAIWGPPPFGINTVSWGSAARGDAHSGKPEDGMLAGMIERGWIVTATDYAGGAGDDTLQPFVIGKIEAANAVDNVRAAHQLLETFGADLPGAWETVVWGHSQGGHAAVWTGQLLEAYDSATRSPGGPTLRLAGVVAEAPASNILVTPEIQGEEAVGFGLFDWVAHTRLQLTGQPAPIPIAPFFFSYVFGAWTDHAEGGLPSPDQMPAFPATGPLDPAAMLLTNSLTTMAQMVDLCWADGEEVSTLAAPYAHAPFLVAPLADGATIDGLQHGNFDHTLANPPTPGLAAWASWLHANNPGPLGRHGFPTIPMRDGRPAPMLISAGANDGVVHCIGADPGTIPTANECMPVALHDALMADYCGDGEDRGHLALLIWQPEAGVTVADHSDVTGLIGAASVDDLRFTGSPLERFMTAAFAGELAPGCTQAIGNPLTAA